MSQLNGSHKLKENCRLHFWCRSNDVIQFLRFSCKPQKLSMSYDTVTYAHPVTYFFSHSFLLSAFILHMCVSSMHSKLDDMRALHRTRYVWWMFSIFTRLSGRIESSVCLNALRGKNGFVSNVRHVYKWPIPVIFFAFGIWPTFQQRLELTVFGVTNGNLVIRFNANDAPLVNRQILLIAVKHVFWSNSVCACVRMLFQLSIGCQ